MIVLPTQSNEQLLRIVRIIVYGFKIIGLAPFSFQRTKSSTRNSRGGWFPSEFLFSKIGLAYNILLFILVLVIGAFAIPLIFSMQYPKQSPITQASHVTLHILCILASCFIIVSASFMQNKAISIMNRLLEVDCLLSNTTKHPRSRKKSFIFLVVQMLFNALLGVTFGISERVFIKSLLHIIIINVPLLVIFNFFMQYSIVLALLTSELESLNKNLSNFEEFPNYLFRPLVRHNCVLSVLSSSTHSSQLAILKVLRNIRITLSEVSEDVGDFFSIPTLPSVAFLSLALILSIYYLVIPIVCSSTDSDVSADIHTVAWIILCLYPLILLSFNVTKTLKEAKLTGPIIHKALAKTTSPEIEKELERFSLQLTHENLSFTAYGFFSLDFTLIQSVITIPILINLRHDIRNRLKDISDI